MTNYYFDPTGVDTSNIINGDTILDTDVSVPIEALKSAVQDMDTNLYNTFGHKGYGFTGVGPSSTTSATFVPIAGAELTVETYGGDVELFLLGSFESLNSDLNMTFSKDSVLDPGGSFCRQVNTSIASEVIYIGHIYRSVPAGTHTFQVHWRVSANTAYISQAGTWARFRVREL